MEQGPGVDNLSQWVEQYYALLYRYAYRLTGSATDAEDLTQQAFLVAQRKIHQLREPARAKAWLCTVVRNAYLKSLRKSGDAVVPVSLDQIPEPAHHSSGNSSVDDEELQRVLNELSEEYRTPLILFYFEEFSYKEIAAQMGVPLGTVMSRLARGKQYLRRRLSSEAPVTSRS